MENIKFKDGEVKVKLFKKDNIGIFNQRYFLVKNNNKNYVVINDRNYSKESERCNRLSNICRYEIYELPEDYDLSLLEENDIKETGKKINNFDCQTIDLVIEQWSKASNKFVCNCRPPRYRGKGNIKEFIKSYFDNEEYIMYLINCYDGEVKVFSNLDDYYTEVENDKFNRSPEGQAINCLIETKEDIIIHSERIKELKKEIKQLQELIVSKELELEEEQEEIEFDKKVLDRVHNEYGDLDNVLVKRK